MRRAILISILLLASTFLMSQSSIFSQEEKSGEKDTQMQGMMHEHCKQALAELDKINANIDRAHKQNEVNALHTSLSEIQKSLTQVKDHINACMGMESKEHKH